MNLGKRRAGSALLGLLGCLAVVAVCVTVLLRAPAQPSHAERLLAAHEPASALKLFNRELKRHPDDVRACLGLGKALMMTGDVDLAERWSEHGLELAEAQADAGLQAEALAQAGMIRLYRAVQELRARGETARSVSLALSSREALDGAVRLMPESASLQAHREQAVALDDFLHYRRRASCGVRLNPRVSIPSSTWEQAFARP